ncbi:hypothetical protein [Vibrio crassostreae]|uniref:hypothetical protein n=1 Tax=Vibrio crassostreae TaxID=246167 RepID=UPI001B30AFA7|nr:hypothetical protein [Vibrio crassostreae]
MSSNRYSASVEVTQVHSNTQQEVIQITEDRLENILIKHSKNLNLKDSWIGPLSILLTIIIAHSTATFTDTFGIKGTVWEAIFYVLGGISLFWFIVNLSKIYVKRKEMSIKYLICKIKNSELNS